MIRSEYGNCPTATPLKAGYDLAAWETSAPDRGVWDQAGEAGYRNLPSLSHRSHEEPPPGALFICCP
jgi:hypothetical protein